MSPKSFQPALICALLSPVAVLGQTLDTTFTYQGHLKQSGAPFTGTADLECKLFDALAGGIQIGPTVTASSVAVTNGLFTAHLDFGFGICAGTAPARFCGC